MKIDYSNLTFTELVNKIGNSRFFDLPKMLKEILSRLTPQETVFESYKIYQAIFTQTGTNAPEVSVIVNELGGDVTFLYDEVGYYTINTNGLFKSNKTFVDLFGLEKTAGNFSVPDNEFSVKHAFAYIDDPNQENQIYIESGYLYNATPSGIGIYHSDSVILKPTLIEIRVYN